MMNHKTKNGSWVFGLLLVFLGGTLALEGDLDSDGNGVLVWRNTRIDDVAAWLMNGLSVTVSGVIAGGVPLAFEVQ